MDPRLRVDDGADEQPWERPWTYRADSLPHRGRLLKLIGSTSVLLGASSFCCFAVTGFIALPLGLLAWHLAASDLSDMEKGIVDPYGRSPTMTAQTSGRYGVVLSLVGILTHVYLLLVSY
ncbi:MAG: hypothetical protein K2R98_30480 [Gemmataceae bacterium]|nr:hypothetical protein [Gemmataceae bacterium]